MVGPILLKKMGPVLLKIIVKRMPPAYAKEIQKMYQKW
jgi:hypothetical protein